MALNPKEAAVLNLIEEDPAYENYFLKRVSALKWFDPLKRKSYFVPQKAPAPEPANQEGLIMIPQWNVLPYLEKVSQQVTTPGNDKYIDELLAIIKDVSNYKDASGQQIDNYRTWRFFTKILLNLPNEKITLEIIDLIPIWLDSKFSTSLHGAEIAEKLLPKFLNSDEPEEWQKAEMLIEIITDIKWVSLPDAQRNFKERNVEPRTIIEPHWLKEGIEKSFHRIGTVCSIRVIEGLAKKLLSIFIRQYDYGYDLDYEGKKYQIAHTVREDGKHQILVYVLKIPEEWDGISRSKIERVLVTSFDISDFENKDVFVAKVKQGLIKHAFGLLGKELDDPISSIYSLHDYTYIGYNSLYASPEHVYIDDTEKILIYILKEILAVKAKRDKDETMKLLDSFLSREYPYPFFKRLVLFILGKEWDKYREYFNKIINLEEISCFEASDYATELSILLRNNFNKFNAIEKGNIRKIIEAGPQLLPDENPEQYIAYWKQKWLSIIKGDPLFTPLFDEQKKLTRIEKDQFSFGYEFKTSSGFGPSPLTVEEILSLTGTELAIKLKEFRSEKKWEGQTVVAFSNALKDAAMAAPDSFINNLHFFEDVGFIYVYKLLDGLMATWKDKKMIDWGKIFEFIVSYIAKDPFWKDEYIVEPGTWLGGSDHKLVIAIIADLIQEGTKDDLWAFPEEYFDKAKEIIFTLLRNTDSDKEFADYVFHVLNSPCGKLITALVYLALRIARVNAKKGINNDPKWTAEYSLKFDELLDQQVIDAYTSLGRFLPYLAYLDRNWAGDKIRRLGSDTGSKNWVAFMEGYLSIGKVDDDLYKQMKPHYQYGLSYEFRERTDKENLIHHLCLGYLQGYEKLNAPESLFIKIVDEWKPAHLLVVIGFFWMQRDYLRASAEENEEMKEKIIEFWRQLYEKYKGKDESSLTKEDKQILSAASKLASLLPQIDTESYKWLLLSAPYVHEDYNSSFFIEYLDELKDKGGRNETANYIGDIYLKMLEKLTPDFDQKHILSIVEFLYSAGATDSANKICNIYGARGHEFLRDIYERHNKKP